MLGAKTGTLPTLSTSALAEKKLDDLPVELLHDIQLFALSESFPLTSRHTLKVFALSLPSFRARYLLGRTLSSRDQPDIIITKALRYPLCTNDVLEILSGLLPENHRPQCCDLPRRLFRNMAPRPADKWKARHPPLPFLRYLFDSPFISHLNVNAYDGYALTKAVHAKHIPLIQFLLDKGASPQSKNHLSVLIAIRHKELSLVKLLIERDCVSSELVQGSRQAKRRRLEDRVEINQEMLKTAIQCDARDIIDFFMNKGYVPNLKTLRAMRQ